MKIVIFADLDGTILDRDYQFLQVKSLIQRILSLNAAIVLCSSKTRLEIEFYRKELGINDPFVSENGGAIFIPKNYFAISDFTRRTEDYDIIELGVEYSTIRKKLKKIAAAAGCRLTGFGDLSAEEVAKDTGLPLKLARLAKQREYDEPLIFERCAEQKVFDAAKKEGLYVTKGDRFYHLRGQHNKGDAVFCLKTLYSNNCKIYTMGVGNGPNDLPFLAVVDSPFYIGGPRNILENWEKILIETVNVTQVADKQGMQTGGANDG